MSEAYELPKLLTMSPLQGRVKDLGICPYCHKKTLSEKYNDGDWKSDQCSGCLRIFMDSARKLSGNS